MTQAFNLAQLANNLNTSGQVDATDGLYGVLPPGNGGTGQSSLTANNLLLGNGTSGVQFVAPGTSGNLLRSNGTTWQSVAATTVTPTTGSPLYYGLRAWVCWNGHNGGIWASANVSSMTDNGAGNWGVNFTTAMPDSSYTCVWDASIGFPDDGSYSFGQTHEPKTTTQANMYARNYNSGVLYDSYYMSGFFGR